MSDAPKPERGSITWIDLTVGDADAVSQFYSDVVGWKREPIDMKGYSDYGMNGPSSDSTRAGICHARGSNEGLPAQWMIYINVDNLDRALARCQELGGTVLRPARKIGGYGSFGVIRDPAGAVAALFEPEGGVS